MGDPSDGNLLPLSKSDDRRLRHFHRRLERLAPRVRRDVFVSLGVEGFLDTQETILRLQIDIQNEIAAVKQRRPRDVWSHEYMDRLRRARQLSRALGDSLAWTTLLDDRQLIHALHQNDRVPIPSKVTDSHLGTLAFARANTSAEWGLPIIHDITDVLRVGDVTFMHPTPTRRPLAEYRTFELKVSRAGASVIDENGKTSVRLEVSAITNEPFPETPAHLQALIEVSPDGDRLAERARRRPDRRIERQMERMDIARERKYAAVNRFTDIGDQQVFTVAIGNEPGPQWRQLRRAIRTAKREGYAYFSLGGFVGYAVFFNPTGVTVEDMQRFPLPKDIASTLVHDETSGRNTLTINFVPAAEDNKYARLALPLFRWPVPRNAIQDLIRQRLMIVATFNTGWLEKLLRDVGIEVIPPSAEIDQRSFEIVVPMTWEDARGEYHMNVPWEDITVAVQEFRHPSEIVMRVKAASRLSEHITADELFAMSERK